MRAWSPSWIKRALPVGVTTAGGAILLLVFQ